MADLPIFLTKNSVAITVERFTDGTGSRNDLGEIVDMASLTWATTGVIDPLIEPGYTGRYNQSNQGKDTRQRYRLYVGPTVSLQPGDFVTSGEDRYEVGVVVAYESHIEAIMFKI